jgi:hypothetical protein
MRLAGEFDFDRHNFTPGQPIFSTARVNEILFGERVEWAEMPPNSIFGILYRALTGHPKQPWPRESFPDVRTILSRYAASRRDGSTKANWGKAPLSVPPSHFPSEGMPPLRAAYEVRQFAFERWRDEDLSPQNVVNLATLCMTSVMVYLRPHIAAEIGLPLAFETINTMAKTAPFLPKHMRELVLAHQAKEVQLVQ